jgi:hypothetical protein
MADDARSDTQASPDSREDRGARVVRYYYVDEAGDGVLFDRRKRVVVGTEGCSTFFILGLLDVLDPVRLESELSQLRGQLLADPYLKKIPSMQRGQRKTARAFHAKDDCPEVRREVFRLLLTHDLRFFAVVRDKRVIVQKVQEHNKKQPRYRYHPNQLYDRCISRLFRDRLHQHDGYAIHFAKRGNRNRTAALESALEQARADFRHKFGVDSTAPIEITPSAPDKTSALQAVDYFLWSLQRLYERGEDRYWEYISHKVSLVHDVDDTRNHDEGELYSENNPLTAEKAKKEPGI